MTWESTHRGGLGSQPLPAPDDGIESSGHPPGPVGKRWRALFDQASAESRDRILRGRNYARRGRARALHISPGAATAEVVSEAPYNPSLRVRPFDRQEWATITRYLVGDLDAIASLLEGELPPRVIGELERRDVHLLPSFGELSFDCDCGDYIMPCTHVATVFHVLVDALDGDPFLLLTLRGRTREHLMSTLRAHWGDDQPIEQAVDEEEDMPPEADWASSPVPIPDFACAIEQRAVAAAGMLALGPPPGEEDLLATLSPLYAAGGAAAEKIIAELPALEVRRRAPRPEPAPPPPADDGTVDLTELLIDHLAAHDGSSTTAIAKALALPPRTIARELQELEELGIVLRQGRGNASNWWLG